MINLISTHEKACECGQSGGKYIDKINAEYWGDDAVVFGIDNNSFFARLKGDKQREDIYDKWHGKDHIQCWLIRVGAPGVDTIKKVKRKEWRVVQKFKVAKPKYKYIIKSHGK